METQPDITGSENLNGNKSPLDDLVHDQKEDMTSSDT